MIILFFLFFLSQLPAPGRAETSAGNVGVFGGSFDPPTLAHKEIIETAVAKYNLRKLYLVLNLGGRKNHKASASEREDMLRVMLGAKMEKIAVLPLIFTDRKTELDLRLRSQEGVDILYVFMGQDTFERLPATDVPGITWVVVPRIAGKALPSAPNVQIMAVAETNKSVSSTLARRLSGEGDEADTALDEKVAAYIKERGLYARPGGKLEKLQKEFFCDAFRRFLGSMDPAVGDGEKPSENTTRCPEFDAQQSVAGWRDSFVRQILPLDIDEAEAQEFRNNALLRGADALSLKEIPAAGIGPEPQIKTVLKAALPRNTSKRKDYIMNVAAHIAGSAMPEALQKFVTENEIPAYIHNASLAEARAYHKKEGFEDCFRITTRNRKRHFYVFRKYAPERFRLVITNAATPLTRRHYNLLLGHFMSEAFEVTHAADAPIYKLGRGMESVVFRPDDMVVISSLRAMMKTLAELKRPFSCHAMMDPLSESGFQINICTSADSGRTYIFSSGPWADQMPPVLNLLYDRGARTFFQLGIAGGLSRTAQCGDVMIVSRVETEPGKFLEIENGGRKLLQKPEGIKIHDGAKIGFVGVMFEEDRRTIQRLIDSGADCVELELRYLADFCSKKKDCRLSSLLLITDLPADEKAAPGNALDCMAKAEETQSEIVGQILR